MITAKQVNTAIAQFDPYVILVKDKSEYYFVFDNGYSYETNLVMDYKLNSFSNLVKDGKRFGENIRRKYVK